MAEQRSPPPKPRPHRAVAIPSTLFSDLPLNLKTLKVGWLARIFTVFRVEVVLIYVDRGERRNAAVLRKLLEYAETPQYLRKRLYSLSRELRYAGLLPPLRAPHHPSLTKPSFTCEYREGVVLRRLGGGRVLVDVGLEKPIEARGAAAEGARVTVRLAPGGSELVKSSRVPHYWGYSVKVLPSLRCALTALGGCFRVATSRKGDDIRIAWQRLERGLASSKWVLLAFGAHDRGLFEIASSEGFSLADEADIIVNFIPYQGAYTVRTEEAIAASLAVINVMPLASHQHKAL